MKTKGTCSVLRSVVLVSMVLIATQLSFLQQVSQMYYNDDSHTDILQLSESCDESLISMDDSSDEMVRAKRKVYTCGHPYINLAKCLFDDFDFMGKWDNNMTLQKQDILVYGMHGPCNNTDGFLPSKCHSPQGKVLYINGEPNGDIAEMFDRSDLHRIYQLGPGLVTQHSMNVIYGALVLNIFIPSKSQPILNPSTPRPGSSLEIDGTLYLASKCLEHRNKAASMISKIVKVYHGKCVPTPQTNTTIKHATTDVKHSWTTNHLLYNKYKYCLVMENSDISGYITEKIVNAFLGGCLPIYYGTKEIFNIFNPDAFIFFDIEKPQIALQKIQRVQANHSLYEQMMTQPILLDGWNTINKFMSVCDGIGDASLKSRIRAMMSVQGNDWTYNTTVTTK